MNPATKKRSCRALHGLDFEVTRQRLPYDRVSTFGLRPNLHCKVHVSKMKLQIFAASLGCLLATAPMPAAAADSYESLVARDQPLVWWRFESGSIQPSPLGKIKRLQIKRRSIATKVKGPTPKAYPLFSTTNQAIQVRSSGRITVTDPGTASGLDFTNGDAITMEAWVRPNRLNNDQQVYIIGKGRTNRAGFKRENQNYALRLRGMNGTARVSFLFRRAPNRNRNDYHRWNSSLGFELDGLWHHVAVTYEFGKPKSIRGYVDGKQVAGSWDIGGPTTAAPVVDNDELWIGSSLGGAASCTFPGLIDEVALYRQALTADRMKARYRAVIPPVKTLQLSEIPTERFLFQIFEGVRDRSWAAIRREPTKQFKLPALAIFAVPRKYNPRGIITDRSNPLRLQADTRLKVRPGRYDFVIRAKNATRLFIDGKMVGSTKFMSANASGHESVPQLAKIDDRIVSLPAAHTETRFSLDLDGRMHHVKLEAFVGGARLRLEMGELVVAFARSGEPFRLLAPMQSQRQLATDQSWRRVLQLGSQQMAAINGKTRRKKASLERKHWHHRRRLARGYIAGLPVLKLPAENGQPARNMIDRWIHHGLAAKGIKPAPLTKDDAFLRRVYLDTVGVIPTLAEIEAFGKAKPATRRQDWIVKLVRDPRWADHWVSYWQDVLAENPGILKPKLNNTGPFRWWIYESLLDNKPLDRFVTELLSMEGSRYGGGTAGFAMATQNDAPMAAKAHIVAQAFLGINLKCARCHDAPYVPYRQKQLFQLAAMLNNGSLILPKTSVVPVAAAKSSSRITRSLSPGVKISPRWPFEQLVKAKQVAPLLKSIQDNAPRQRLAAIVTAPQNRRFAQVMVNRIWLKLMGRGLVESVDQWHEAKVVHPQLLDNLARELVYSGYDLKHLVRLILNSNTYQRQVEANEGLNAEVRQALFATPTRRRMTAEQVADSLFLSAEKRFDAESLTLDPEGRRRSSTFLNLGVPRRAWEFTSLSNERDRPALALPAAQTILDLLVAFGWQSSRPSPIAERDHRPTILQPLSLANGVAAQRVTRASDDSAFTKAALQAGSARDLVDELFMRILSRPAEDGEAKPFVELLKNGFKKRRRPNQPAYYKPFRGRRNAVSWSNHLHQQATKIKLALERLVRAGDPPTKRLENDWRQRLEDIIWALINSPEFVFVP